MNPSILEDYVLIHKISILDKFSFCNAILFASLFAVVLCLLCRKTTWMERLGLRPFLLFLVLALVRLLLPIQLPFTQVVGSWTILPAIRDFFRMPLFSWQGRAVQVGAVLGAIWALGTAFLLGRFFWQWARHRKQTARCPLAPPALMEDVKEWIPSFQGEVRLADGDGVPYVSGFFRPVIFLPGKEYSLEELRLVLLHEWSHFRHRDQWSKLLCHLLCCLFWWNPLLWLLKRQMDRLLELRCDFSVLKDLVEREQQDYYTMLLKEYRTMGKRRYRAPQGIAALASGHHHEIILQRFQLGLNFSQVKQGSKIGRKLLCAAMVLVFCLSYLVIFQPRGLPEGAGSVPEDGGELFFAIPTDEAYLTPNEDGSYTLHWGGTESVVEDITEQPFCDLSIVEQGE